MSRTRRDFAQCVVVVTGGGSGLGAAYARRFARAGARLALLDVDAASAGAVAAELSARGSEAVAMSCDVRDEGACREALTSLIRRFGGIDVLVNNAGITHRSAFAETEMAVYRRVMEVNFFGSLHCTKAALPSLIERGGLIVAVSSIAGLAPLYGRTGYAASKHAVQGFFSSLRAELAPQGVDVLIVCPGFTATGIGAAALAGDGRPVRHPQSTVGRVAEPEAVADAVYHAACRGDRLLVLSAVGKTTYLLQRLSPVLYERIMARALRRELARS
jgi:NAD(P)-dependent dehydrogenase (short-subunit alcohol dehydrogenase family)